MCEVVHFGAGNIGRGFIGALLSMSGYHITFVDIDERVIGILGKEKKYKVRIVGDSEELLTISPVDGLSSMSPNLPSIISESDLITCAVGPNVLSKIAVHILAGLKERKASKNTNHLYIIACENMIRASSALFDIIYKQSDFDLQNFINTHVSFLDSAVDRIVPITPPDPELTVTVESYYEWCIESKHIKEGFHSIHGVHFVDDLQPYIERKLFTLNTAHTYIAWMGHLCGDTTILDCMKNASIVDHVKSICNETAQVLIEKHGFQKEAHDKYIDSILQRFRNTHILDSIYRIGRSPVRKLSRNERFIAPLMLAIGYGTAYEELLRACACGLQFENEDDEEAKSIQALLRRKGVGEVFSEVSSLIDDNILMKIAHKYNNLMI